MANRDHPTQRLGSGIPDRDYDACGVAMACRLTKPADHELVQQALTMLGRLGHRGAVGADGQSGDGAGMLCEIPHDYLATQWALPPAGQYAVAAIMAWQEEFELDHDWQQLAEQVGLRWIGLRRVPTNSDLLGPVAAAIAPSQWQAAVTTASGQPVQEQQLYQLRMAMRTHYKAANQAFDQDQARPRPPAIVSFSTSKLAYKAMVVPQALGRYFLDLQNPQFKARFAIVHTRFSTNTLPDWTLIQPFHSIAHNGEFNTIKGNASSFRAQRAQLERQGKENLAGDVILDTRGSDSCQFDDVVNWRMYRGEHIEEVLTRFMPPAWESEDSDIDPMLRSCFEYMALDSEPWDGPALIAFADRHRVGACLDRSGLRPARLTETKDGDLYLSSEDGVVDLPAANILRKDVLGAGDVLVADLKQGALRRTKPVRRRVADRFFKREDLPAIQELPAIQVTVPPAPIDERELAAHQYSEDDIRQVIEPMARHGKEPTASMGADLPLAGLVQSGKILPDFFKQKFAQVTNPALDPIREERVMSLHTWIRLTDGRGRERVYRLPSPYLDRAHWLALMGVGGARRATLPLVFNEGEGLAERLDRLAQRAVGAVESGLRLLVLSDDPQHWQSDRRVQGLVPPLLAVARIHEALTKAGLRPGVRLAVDSAEPRTVHHGACLVGCGADVVYPRLALACALRRGGTATAYIEAMNQGLKKIMSKMGISTVRSYRGAGIFDVLGLADDIMEHSLKPFALGLGGVDYAQLEAELARRLRGDEADQAEFNLLRWSPWGAKRLHSPDMIAALQRAVRGDDEQAFAEYAAEVDELGRAINLRGQWQLASPRPAITEATVEPMQDLYRRMVTGAMSLGSISREAHETIAIAANRVGARSNSGEGGEDAARDIPLDNGDDRRSAIRQVASGRFGVTLDYLREAQELQIKVAQGAKPGEGGQLPGSKVDEYIGKLRHTVPGTPLISPPPHHDIYSIEDLAQLIHDLKTVNPQAQVSVKLVAASGVDVVAAGVAKAGADVIVISGHEGGTGASPLSSIHHAGLPWEIGLAATHRMLTRLGLRDQVRLQTDGGLRTPKDLITAVALGADEWGFGSLALIALGCVMMRVCHTGRCPVGIATQDPELRELFPGEPEHLVRMFKFMAIGVRRELARLGYRSLDELRGEYASILKPVAETPFDFTAFLAPQTKSAPAVELVQHGMHHQLWRPDDDFVQDVEAQWNDHEAARLNVRIGNQDRTFGTRLAALARRRRRPLHLELSGYAGPSLMAFAGNEIEAQLTGGANDYAGKGLSGGILAIRPERAISQGERPVVTGNVCLYGATSGQFYAAGRVGERFAVRNSGAVAVVEGMAGNGCEYMTGGLVINLAQVGANFGAGMSGGMAYLFGNRENLSARLNTSSVELFHCDPVDRQLVEHLLRRHVARTNSARAQAMLADWPEWSRQFFKIVPLGRSERQQSADVTKWLYQFAPRLLPTTNSWAEVGIHG